LATAHCSNESYWLPKLTRNKERDARPSRQAASLAALKADGWHVLTVWECETRDAEALRTRLKSFLGPR
jgi:DNA mismatch endonuclease, patch repair protein